MRQVRNAGPSSNSKFKCCFTYRQLQSNYTDVSHYWQRRLSCTALSKVFAINNTFRPEFLNLQYTHLEEASVLCHKISDTRRKFLRKWLNNFLFNQLSVSKAGRTLRRRRTQGRETQRAKHCVAQYERILRRRRRRAGRAGQGDAARKLLCDTV